jgi:hypothetical protein
MQIYSGLDVFTGNSGGMQPHGHVCRARCILRPICRVREFVEDKKRQFSSKSCKFDLFIGVCSCATDI